MNDQNHNTEATPEVTKGDSATTDALMKLAKVKLYEDWNWAEWKKRLSNHLGLILIWPKVMRTMVGIFF